MPPASIDEHHLGLSWTQDEPLQRTSHAIVDEDARVWLIDPVEDPAILERIGVLGQPAGVVQLLDRHNRDCAALATRLGVPHHRAFAHAGPLGPFEVVSVLNGPIWKEAALWWRDRRLLVVAELVGTAPIWAVGEGQVGIHPAMRLKPPRRIGGFTPEHLLVGHGLGVHGPDAAPELSEAFAHARSDVPQLLKSLPGLFKRSS